MLPLLSSIAIAAPPPQLVLSGGLVDRAAEDGRVDGVRASAGLALGDLELGVEGDLGLDPYGWSDRDELVLQVVGDSGLQWPVENDRWGGALVGRWAVGAGPRSGLGVGLSLRGDLPETKEGLLGGLGPEDTIGPVELRPITLAWLVSLRGPRWTI